MAERIVVSFHQWTRGMWRRLLRDRQAEQSLNLKLVRIKQWMWVNNIREYRYRVPS